jgi:ATP-dependent RNA helicase DeaD
MVKRDVPFQALILAPTRELAIQITAEIQELGKGTPIRVMTVYGGQAVRTQAQKLEKGAEIIVGTPGRVMDMVERGHLHFRNVAFAVLDEVDRMLDIGFREDIRQILEKCPEARQTVFVSATLSPEIEKLARRYLKNPEKVVVTGGSLTVSLVKQYHLPVYPWDKRRLLVHLLKHEEPALTLIFCRLKRTVDELTKLLNAKGIEAHALHGDMSQGKRNTTMKLLREGDLSVLISSDLTSRGIDVEGISHVINYDLPEDVELYVHRIGRTARAGRGGTAWSLVTPEQGELLTQIEMLINTEIPKLDYPDFKASAPPSDWRGDLPKGMVREGAGRPGGPEQAGSGGGAPGAGSAGPGGPGEGAAEAEKVSRLTRAAAPELPKGADPTKFPGGVVPTKLPPRRMFGRIPGGRH